MRIASTMFNRRPRLRLILTANVTSVVIVAGLTWYTQHRPTPSAPTPAEAAIILPLVCMFTTFKPHSRKTALYNNTLYNWASLDNGGNVLPILYVVNSTPPALMTSAGRLGWTVLQVPRVSSNGLPYFKDMYFNTARRFHNCTFYGFVNGDILFSHGLVNTLNTVSEEFLGRTLVTGRRTNVPWTQNQSLYLPDDITEMAKRGTLFATNAEDYFFIARNAFPWHLVHDELVIARPGYDNFLVAIAIHNNVSVVDATNTLLAVHQTDTDGNLAGWGNKDNLYNWHRIGKFNYGQGLTSCAPYETHLVETNVTITKTVAVRKRNTKC